MQFLLTYLRFHSNKVRVVGLIGLVGAVVAVVLILRPGAGGFTLLGDVNAAPPAQTEADARYANAPTPAVRPGLNDTQADQGSREAAAAALQPDDQYQERVLTALNCARAQKQLPALPIDATLSDAAVALGRQLAARPDTSLADFARSRYTVAAVVPISFAQPVEPEPGAVTDPALEQPAAAVGACDIGGVDATQLGLEEASAAIGIAVFPDPHPEDGWDDMSAVIVAK